ncbi:SHOCT domain-containing protein [Roseovarius sp. MBR-79]
MAIAAALTATTALAQAGEMANRDAPFYHGHDMMWGGDQWGGFGMVLGPIFMILILVGIVVGAIYVLRLFGVAGSGQPAHDRALMLLKERYAKGEIDTLEFEERKKLLAH